MIGHTVLLLLSIACLSQASKCGDFKDCASCAAGKEGLFSCMWCESDNACHNSAEIDCTPVNVIPQAFDCPRSPSADQAYNETFAREVAARIAAATVGNEDRLVQGCLDRIPGTRLVKTYQFPCDIGNNTCMGYLAVNSVDKSIIVAFRGSATDSQLIDEGLDYVFKSKRPFISGGKVDNYFYHAFYTVWNGGMERDLQGLILQHEQYEAWFVGHSLGGAMASLASAYCASKKYFSKEKIKIVTFGQPRTGDMEYAMGHDKLVGYHFRLVHHHDLVAHIPPRNFDDLFDSPFHHRYEVWYNNDMTPGSPYQLCTRADDAACSNSVDLLKLNFNDHLVYFNKSLVTWIDSGCA